MSPASALCRTAASCAGLCDALGIVRPIVCGLSLGGVVAQAYAIRYPDHPGKLVLLSMAAWIDLPTIFAASERAGGPENGALAESHRSAA